MRVAQWPAALRTNLAILLLIAATTTRCSIDSQPECPRGCECIGTGEELRCADRGLLGLSLGQPGLRLVSLHNVQAIEIPTTVFGSGTADLRHLSWTGSGVERVLPYNFRACADLESLNLGDNRLTKLPIEAFRPLSRLVHLNLTGNSLVSLPRSVFLGLEKLESVRLADNSIAVLPFQVFESARSLTHLDLTDNFLVSLPDHSFRPNRALRELRLSSNRLTKIPPQLFSGLGQLRVLELADNEIDFLPRGLFNELTNLEKLDLSGNPISRDGRLSPNTFHGLSNLRWLSLSRTRLTTLPQHLWTPVPRLRSLYLSETRIEILEDGDLANLRELRTFEIAGTPLREIDAHVLDDTPMLHHVNLRDNDLTFLPPSLAHLIHINHLELQGNPWACDCRMFWFVRWAEEHVHRAAFDSGLRCGHETEVVDTLQALRYLNCTPPILSRVTPTERWLIRTEVVLECEFTGNPLPSVTWVTPRLRIFHWNPDPSFPDIFVHHPRVHDYEVPQDEFHDDGRIRLLENGSLYISSLHREDVGVYKCVATNPIANFTTYVTLQMDPITGYHIKVFSIAVGAASAAGFLLLTLFIQFLRYLFVK